MYFIQIKVCVEVDSTCKTLLLVVVYIDVKQYENVFTVLWFAFMYMYVRLEPEGALTHICSEHMYMYINVHVG